MFGICPGDKFYRVPGYTAIDHSPEINSQRDGQRENCKFFKFNGARYNNAEEKENTSYQHIRECDRGDISNYFSMHGAFAFRRIAQ